MGVYGVGGIGDERPSKQHLAKVTEREERRKNVRQRPPFRLHLGHRLHRHRHCLPWHWNPPHLGQVQGAHALSGRDLALAVPEEP